MKRHVGLLGTLFILWGALALLVSLALVTLGLGVAALAVGSQADQPGVRITAGFALSVFGALAALGIVGGAVHLWVAVGLSRAREWARIIGIIVSIVDVFVPPIGTALGVYAIWVLANRETRALFEVPPA